jgi:hypothetical protein
MSLRWSEEVLADVGAINMSLRWSEEALADVVL